ncbi:MAG: site-2 protease family protein [Candidatus Cloacimonetes bacterium]|nr:site-2 protease family protein [Candidatus Cloacimonadota bacterium]
MSDSALDKLKKLQEKESPIVEKTEASKKGLFGFLLAILILLVTKFKFVLIFILTKGKLLLGALKIGPILTTFSTMFLSIWVYSSFYGLNLAIGLCVMILIHELGHGAIAKTIGMKVGTPVFIPFFGALITLKNQLKSKWQEALIGAGGPIAGTIGGVLVLLISQYLESDYYRDLFVVISWITFMINFFNLLPVAGLDGDRISNAFRPVYWAPGLLLMVALIYFQNKLSGTVPPFMIFIIILGAFKAWKTHKKSLGLDKSRLVDQLVQTKKYEREDVTIFESIWSFVIYFGLATTLSFLMIYSNSLLPKISG